MRGLIHLVTLVLALPYVLLALLLIMFDRSIKAGSLWNVLDTTVNQAAWLMPWGLLEITAATLILAGVGFSSRHGRIASGTTTVLAAASLTFLLIKVPTNVLSAEFVIFVPAVLAIVSGTWLTALRKPVAS